MRAGDVLCSDMSMKRRSSELSSVSAGGSALGRSAFQKISAVEGIKFSREAETMFSGFDRQSLSAGEQRRIFLERRAKKA